jgi:DNA-binding PadR family transcriptional regulator
LLVLHALAKGPQHGYGIMLAITQLFGGAYAPSPGVVYPTLELLEDQGLVRSARSSGRRTYGLTRAGRAALAANVSEIDRIVSQGGRGADGERFPIRRAAVRLGRTLRLYVPEMPPSQRVEVARLLDATRAQVIQLMEQP